MTREELRRIAQTLIDTHNARLKASAAIADTDAAAYVNARLNDVIEHCLMVLSGHLSAEQKIPYTDRKLAELAVMESHLQGKAIEARPTTPISFSLLRTLINDGIEIWESSSSPFLVLHYEEVKKAFRSKI